MATIENFMDLMDLSWDISRFVDACYSLTYAEYDKYRFKVSSDLDNYLLNTNKEDEDYIKGHEIEIRTFKLFLTKALNFVPHGDTNRIGLKCTEFEISELKRLRNELQK